MFRLIPWIIALLATCDLLQQTIEARTSLLRALDLRRALLVHPSQAQQNFCQSGEARLGLLWREGGRWTDACPVENDYESSLPRYWKIEARLKYRLLFLRKLPITMSIVILS